MLAQELLAAPRMSNHARGLWGYTGATAAGEKLTIQATGMGGPSAALVLADLAELGIRRAIRVGTCVALGERARLGELLLVERAIAAGGSAAPLGVEEGASAEPDRQLSGRLGKALGKEARRAAVASFDSLPHESGGTAAAAGDMQTASVLGLCAASGIPAAAVLVVSEAAGGGRLKDGELEDLAKRAGRAAAEALL